MSTALPRYRARKQGSVGGIKSKLRLKVMPLLLNLLATVAFVLLALTSHVWIGLAVAGLAVAGLAWHALGTNFTETISAQLLLLAGLLVAYSQVVPSASTAALALTGIGIGALIANQPLLSYLIERPSIKVANLPGYVAGRETTIPAHWLYAGATALVAVLGGCVAAKINPWIPAVLAAAAFVAAAVTTLQAVRVRGGGQSVDKRLRKALIAYDPQFAFYFTAPPNSEYHIGMWYPYLKRIGKPFVIILREAAPLPIVAAMVDVPVLFCEHERFVDQVVLPSMKACFYANNGSKNSDMVRFNRLTHIQLLHGDSDKASSYNPVTGIYDRIFVAGQAGIDRYEANGVPIPAQKFDIVGRPQVEDIRVVDSKICDLEHKTVLYASTWAGNYSDASYCSLHLGEQIVRKLLDRNATVVLRPHPYARRDLDSARQLSRIEQMLAEDAAKTGRRHRFGEESSVRMSLFDCINAADVLISDVSSVASDWLFSEKPFALTNVLGEERGAFEAAFPLARAAYVIDKDAGNLDEVLEELLKIDSLAEMRRNLRTYYLGDFPTENYADGFVSAASRYVSTARA
jgi:CDP-glycerol:poly(glycerophosphate) glycerophosphotransferase